MKLKFSLLRGDRTHDLVATVDATVTVGELADRIVQSDPSGAGGAAGASTLAVAGPHGVTLPSSSILADTGVHSGASLIIVPRDRDGTRVSAPAAVAHVLSGVDAGKEFSLGRGTNHIGRERASEIRLNDPLVSRQHAKVVIGELIEIVDLGSANGLVVGGAPVSRTVLRPGDLVTVGDTQLSLRLTAAVTDGNGGNAEVAFNRSPRIAPRYPGGEHEAPEPPDRLRRQRFPLIPLIAPVLVGGAMFALTRSPMSLIFVGLSPLMLIGNVLEGRINGKKDFKEECKQFRADLAGLDEELGAALEVERRGRLAENPATADVVQAVRSAEQLVWTRRPEHAEFLELRLGVGRLPSRHTVEVARGSKAPRELMAEIYEVVARRSMVDAVPVVESFTESGGVGVAGPRERALAVARALVVQIVGLHSPAEVVVAGAASASSAAGWEWLKWLPHTSSPHSPLPELHLTATAADTNALAERLMELVRARAAAKAEGAALPIVMIVVDDPPGERAALVEAIERGREVGVHALWVAPGVDRLPAVCRTFVDVTSDSPLAGFVRRGVAVAPLSVERVDEATATEVARRLAPLQDAGAFVEDASDLPRGVPLLTLIGRDLATSPDAVIERWRESSSILTGPRAVETPRMGSLRAVLGQAAAEPMTIDLRLHGPHALVGGTTGSGKSELLQSWILALAAAYSPQRLTFLLVDYKGGSAFRECRDLPHTVGLVTDLTPHLVRRTLTSLNAELRHREEFLAARRAKDLMSLEKAGATDAPPSLIIIVDEFAALVQEMPEFVDGMVNVGQRGRSLGLHLVLATQRPAGVIKDNLRANTNLRIALRVADEADSSDVLGSPAAAAFSAETPGRAMVKTGPGRLVAFQSAYVGGQSLGAQPAPEIGLTELKFGRGVDWAAPEGALAAAAEAESPDIVRLASSIAEAARLAAIPAPRKPWLEELAEGYELGQLPAPRVDSELVFGVADAPARQQQPLVAFRPDHDGNLVVYGTGGAGKSTLLRSIATAAGFTIRGGPCHVYGLDFGSQGLRMLESLPHVAAIVDGDDHERVGRTLERLRAMIDERAERYAVTRAGSLTDYRRLAGAADEPRVLLLLDGIAAFRSGYEVTDKSRYFDMLLGIAADGRPVGVHLVVSADRQGAVPASLASSLQRRVVLRLADANEYALLGVATDVLDAKSAPGRGMLDGLEMQVAALGGKRDTGVQAEAIAELAASMRRAGSAAAPAVERLSDLIPASTLPPSTGGLPVLGVESRSLAPLGFPVSGSFLVSGPPGSGRTTTLAHLRSSVLRWRNDARLLFLGGARSSLSGWDGWTATAHTAADASALATHLPPFDQAVPVALFIESVAEFMSSAMDDPASDLVKKVLAAGGLVVAEGETSTLNSNAGLLGLVKGNRCGIALSPDQVDGTPLYRTAFPRLNRADFPPGRGLFVYRGRTSTVQVALPDDADDPQLWRPGPPGGLADGSGA